MAELEGKNVYRNKYCVSSVRTVVCVCVWGGGGGGGGEGGRETHQWNRTGKNFTTPLKQSEASLPAFMKHVWQEVASSRSTGSIPHLP